MAFWGYKDPVLVDFPRVSEVLNQFTYGPDPEREMGAYWPKGREYVRDKLRVIRPPDECFGYVERVEYEPGTQGRRSGEGTLFMERDATVGETKAYLRTYSSFHGWQEVHPDQTARDKGGEGDLIDWMFDEMANHDGGLGDENKVVRMEWGSGLVMARRK